MDLPDTFTVEITQEDIDRGLPKACFQCPVALALMRHFGGEHVSANVDRLMAFVYGVPGHPAELKFGHNGYDFIAAFDVRDPVSPRTVTLTRV